MREKRRIYKTLSALLSCVFLVSSLFACADPNADKEPDAPTGGKFDDFELLEGDQAWTLNSTDGKLAVNVYYYQKSMVYEVTYGGKEVVNKSTLGLKTGSEDLTTDLTLLDKEENSDVEISYTTITGKKAKVETEYNELIVKLKKGDLNFDVIMRAYNDGFAFRYNLDSEYASTQLVSEEVSEFALPEGATATFQEADTWRDYYSYEESYTTRVNSGKTGLRGTEAAMPLIYQTTEGVWTLLTEADLYGHDYIGSFLRCRSSEGVLQTIPSYGAESIVEVSLPFESPWRLGVVGGLDTIVESTLAEDVYGEVEYWKPDNYDELTEEEKEIYNYDWVTPGAAAWDWLKNQNTQGDYVMHMEYLNFALENNLKWIILDGGWNPGNPESIKLFKKLVKIAHENDIKVMVWGWAHNPSEEEALIEKLDWWKEIGIDGLKIDYFDGQQQDTINRVESQETLRITERLYQECAKRKMVLNCHGCNKPTGERRVYPHVFNREGIRGNENLTNYYIYDMVNFAYLRGTVGPSDYTPTLNPTNPEQSTIGSQLAMHVLLETGSISLADTIEAYNESIAKDFIMGLPNRFDDVKFLDGNVNQYCVLMRNTADTYYVAGITIDARKFNVNLSFLEEGKQYTAEIYYDEVKTNDGWSPIVPLGASETVAEQTQSAKLYKRTATVNNSSTLKIDAPKTGGFVVKIVEKN